MPINGLRSSPNIRFASPSGELGVVVGVAVMVGVGEGAVFVGVGDGVEVAVLVTVGAGVEVKGIGEGVPSGESGE